ncbi:PTS transporter subunit EIIC [Lacrimispora celerecrescens]|uniref:PTS system beta-glucosides-specific IIC component n=1 Tax=[Clostridium] celerecrescens 18A TaxID=1286362 RepID=A0A2M8Z1P8_9FIRM|nr:PTS transporter subunit EIIC [Lacrimispora celerecrescens]PJJ27378.1 PTS system beta-glucosides-specific IIC component [[Clostridium] celerecrescens 18A]
MKYVEMSKQVLEHVGGIENLNHVEHCATRLRLHYNSKKLVNEEALKGIENVLSIVSKAGQVQIIIGPNVNEAYNDFLDTSGWKEGATSETAAPEEPEEKKAMYYVNKFGNFMAAVFMPIVPALITGGMILAFKNLLVNYFGVAMDSGTAVILSSIFSAAFTFLPVYIGFTMAKRLKMEPIMGAFLGGLLVSSNISGAAGLSFLGIGIPVVEYTGSVLPIMLGIGFMYFVDKLFQKYIPETVRYFLKPLCTMIVVVPVTLIVLGPIGTVLSTYVGVGITNLMNAIGGIAMPVFAVVYPYMVMLGLDKAIMPIGFNSVATIGYDPAIMVMGFISNLCIGGSALAVATTIRNDKSKKGMIASFGITALCGVTEPAFYGSLIMRPKVLIGTAIGAASAGLVAGIFGLKSYVMGGCPGLLTALFFVDKNGGLGNFFLAAIVSIVAVAVSFVSCKFILSKTE